MLARVSPLALLLHVLAGCHAEEVGAGQTGPKKSMDQYARIIQRSRFHLKDSRRTDSLNARAEVAALFYSSGHRQGGGQRRIVAIHEQEQTRMLSEVTACHLHEEQLSLRAGQGTPCRAKGGLGSALAKHVEVVQARRLLFLFYSIL